MNGMALSYRTHSSAIEGSQINVCSATILKYYFRSFLRKDSLELEQPHTMHSSVIMVQRDFRTLSKKLWTIALRPCVLELGQGSGRLIKDSLDSILPVLTSIINTSIATKMFPTQWKLAEVTPMPKDAYTHIKITRQWKSTLVCHKTQRILWSIESGQINGMALSYRTHSSAIEGSQITVCSATILKQYFRSFFQFIL